MAEDESDEAGYTLDTESFLRTRAMLNDWEGSPVNQRRSLGTSNQRQYRQTPGIQFYNNSSETAPAGCCLKLESFSDGAHIHGQTLGDGQPILKITKPTTTFGLYMVNDMLDVEAGGFGTCYDVGDVPFAYLAGTAAEGEGYGPKPSEWLWVKGYPCGVRCYGNWRATDKIGYGCVSPIVSLLGKTTGLTARVTTAPGTGTMQIYANVASVLTETTMTVTCLNLSSTAVTSGSYVQAKFIDGNFFVDFEDCG